MQQLLSLWSRLDMRRRVIIAGATAAMFVLVLAMAQIASRPSMALLYAELEPNAAGEVVRALEQRNVAYDVRSDSIFVEADQRDTLRMTLASEGLPANGAQGYELLDSLSGFGTTAQMFDAAYWRAKEGELARTIVSLSSVSSARVHIARDSGTSFQRADAPTASVFLTARSGDVDQGQARAMRFLVASAVPGLSPEDVSVIDNLGRLITNEAKAAGATISEDRSDSLRDRVQRLVEARVGKGNAVVEVSVDTVTQSESILERHFDPDGRVAISTDTEELSSQSENGASGSVTVASNMPDGEAAGGQNSTNQNTETRERVNYEVSETTREITRVPGAIRRLTVAVLVNGTTEVNEEGREVFVPVPQPELDALHALVASAVGYDEARGDQITLRSMPFEQPVIDGTVAPLTAWYENLDIGSLLKLAFFGLVATLIGLFVIRPVLTARTEADEAALPALPPAGTTSDVALDGEIDNGLMPLNDLPMVMPQTAGDGAFDFEAGLPETDDPVSRLKGLIQSRQDESVDVLRGWLSETEEAST